MKEDAKRPEKPRDGLTRRDFLRGGAVAGLATTGLLGEAAVAQETAAPKRVAGVEILGPAAVPFTLTINGKPHKVNLEPRVTLLDALRDPLGMTGAKRVCDRGTCGACTVILEGRPVYACSVLAIDARGKHIETVESLGTVESVHPLQAAFVDNDAQQCGFCTPGMVMAAKALLDRHPDPSLEQIHAGLAGNICRCGTYAGVRKAVAAAARGGHHG